MKYRLVAMDLDGTLLRSDRKVSERTKEALRACVDAGVIFAIASGRSFSSLPQELVAFPGITYAITGNGAAVYRTLDSERIFHFPMKQEAAESVLEIAEAGWINYEVFVDGIPYAREEYVKNPRRFGVYSENSIRYVKETRRPLKSLREFAWEHRERLDGVCIRVADRDAQNDLEGRLRNVKDLMITSSAALYVEVGDVRTGKGNALRLLAESLGISREEVLAFGNEENDVDMLRYAGTGVAVDNSSESVKKAADAITGSNDADGVAAFLEKIYRE